MVQLSQPYLITGKTIALTIWAFVGRVILELMKRVKLWETLVPSHPAYFPLLSLASLSWRLAIWPMFLEGFIPNFFLLACPYCLIKE